MMDDADQHPVGAAADGGGTIAVFLGLYLLVLAFFILLVSISTVEKIKSDKVKDSLTSAFTSILPPAAELRDFAAKEGDILSGEVFQSRITDIYATAIQVVKVEVITPGRLMRVVMLSDALFYPGEARLREGQVPFLDRTVAALSARPPDMRHELEIVMDSATGADHSLPPGQTLETRRAGALVRDLLQRGAPPDSVSMGVAPGDPARVTLWFHTRFLDESRRRFEADPAARAN